jgi:hypothetical protein
MWTLARGTRRLHCDLCPSGVLTDDFDFQRPVIHFLDRNIDSVGNLHFQRLADPLNVEKRHVGEQPASGGLVLRRPKIRDRWKMHECRENQNLSGQNPSQ